MSERLSRLGAAIGNWNDKRELDAGRGDNRSDRTLRWRVLDRFASYLYTLPHRGR